MLLSVPAASALTRSAGGAEPAPAPPAPAPLQHAPGPQAPGDATPAAEPAPVRIAAEAIGLRAQVVPIGLDRDGTLDEPPLERTRVAGWYRGGAVPGEPGPAVIVGHRDTRAGPSVFHRLGELVPGDTVRIGRADGSTALFRVRRTERVDKDRFPAAEVYGALDRAALRLVTCAEPFDPASGHYERNLIVYGRLVRG
ncbi:class F sortase [Streptomonospora sp. PA3]|nr:class F sortase [Streptomonospora sp. PA3]